MGAARLSWVPISRISHLKSTIWTNSLNTPRQKVIHCPTDHIRRTAVELPSLTRRKAMRSNSSSAVRDNILQTAERSDGNAYAAEALAQANVLSVISRP